jgi:hypothetical protein
MEADELPDVLLVLDYQDRAFDAHVNPPRTVSSDGDAAVTEP